MPLAVTASSPRSIISMAVRMSAHIDDHPLVSAACVQDAEPRVAAGEAYLIDARSCDGTHNMYIQLHQKHTACER
eukprot:6187262-Pleurochrysis_carterae.AAC.4